MFDEHVTEKIIEKSNELTEKHVVAAVIYLRTCCYTEQHIGKMVYRDAQGFKVTAERLQVVMNREWLTSDVSLKNVHLCRICSIVVYEGLALIVLFYFLQVMEAYIQDLALRVGEDRYLCHVYRSKFLVDVAKSARKVKASEFNNDIVFEKSGAVSRAMDEYFLRDKVVISYVLACNTLIK